MKIMITGGAGFIGSNLIRQLIAETDHEVVNVDKLTYAGNLGSLTSIAKHSRYQFEKIDICDASAVDDVFRRARPDAVMHLAAESHVDRSIQSPDVFIQSNIVGTFNLLQASLNRWKSMRESGEGEFRFHHVSTDEVYGSLADGDPAFCESSPYEPHSPYSASKAASDHIVRAWMRTYGLPVVISNCSNNYGPFQYPEKLIPMVILSCLSLKPIPVFGNGKQIRDWLHVDDHCRALRIVLSDGASGQTYTIGGHCELRNIDLITRICDILDDFLPLDSQSSIKSYSDLITYVDDRPGHDERYAIDASRITNELGWNTRISFDDGLKQTVQWYLDNQQWWQEIERGTHG